ncbi:MAG: hypothetical protein M3Z04_17480 [Chloroflexota bacterium]|nr:hypothetical protein [Chloroflexota bacterium]
MPTDEEIQARTLNIRRLKRIAGALIEGPRALHPPQEVDRFGWLEPDLRLVHYDGPRMWRSLAIYTDDTMNREAGFLKPVIRAAHWNGRNDFGRGWTLPDWPSVTVSLSHFEDQRTWVSEQIKAIQTTLLHLPFVPYGLGAERDGADTAEEGWKHLEIYTNNGGGQSVTFQSPTLPAGDPLTDCFFAVFEGLLGIMQPLAWDGWKEVYNTDPMIMEPRTSWYWHGQPLATE